MGYRTFRFGEDCLCKERTKYHCYSPGSAGVEVRVGETAEFVARMALSHVFDEETEKTVY